MDHKQIKKKIYTQTHTHTHINQYYMSWSFVTTGANKPATGLSQQITCAPSCKGSRVRTSLDFLMV